MENVEIALFPIPGSVSLPHSTVSLHVFEPRYRKMVQDAVAEKRRIGVAHTLKVIAEGKTPPGAPLSEVLSHNQRTYLAHPIFSAGFVQIKETLEDGRLLIEIQMDCRYRIKEEVQQVPYKVVIAEPYFDKPEDSLTELRYQLDKRILELVEDPSGTVQKYLSSSEWLKQTDSEYSFHIFSMFQLDPDTLQNVLELQSAQARLGFLKDLLTRGPVQ